MEIASSKMARNATAVTRRRVVFWNLEDAVILHRAS